MNSLLVLVAVNVAAWLAITGVAWWQLSTTGGLQRGEMTDDG